MGKKVTWNFQVPKPMDDAVERVVEEDMHATKAEFIRDAVREKLVRMNLSTKDRLDVVNALIAKDIKRYIAKIMTPEEFEKLPEKEQTKLLREAIKKVLGEEVKGE